jgi:hypothetical protein
VPLELWEQKARNSSNVVEVTLAEEDRLREISRSKLRDEEEERRKALREEMEEEERRRILVAGEEESAGTMQKSRPFSFVDPAEPEEHDDEPGQSKQEPNAALTADAPKSSGDGDASVSVQAVVCESVELSTDGAVVGACDTKINVDTEAAAAAAAAAEASSSDVASAPVTTDEPTSTDATPAATDEPISTDALPAATDEPTSTDATPAATDEPTSTDATPAATDEPTSTDATLAATDEPISTDATPAATDEPTSIGATLAATDEPTSIGATASGATEGEGIMGWVRRRLSVAATTLPSEAELAAAAADSEPASTSGSNAVENKESQNVSEGAAPGPAEPVPSDTANPSTTDATDVAIEEDPKPTGMLYNANSLSFEYSSYDGIQGGGE